MPILEIPLAIIGDEDVVLGFKALGFKVYPVKEPQELNGVLDEITKTKTGICLVQDSFYNQAKERINSYRYEPFPVFIPFSKDQENELLDSIVKGIRLRATGKL